jgi:trimeric autotransporter adhesin
MMKKKTFIALSSLATLLLVSHSASFADNASAASITTMAGTNFSTWADALFPIQQNDAQILYADLQIEDSNTDARIMSLGAGCRKLAPDNGVIGAYLFLDRARSADQEYYTMISPGVEKYSATWRYRANAYIPVGSTTHETASGWAGGLGHYQYIDFSGNSEFDRKAYEKQDLSIGGDATIGYRLAQDARWEFDVSPYAFAQTSNNAMLGVKGQVNFYNNAYTTVFVGDGYDNVNHYRIFAGISINLGARSNDNTVAAWMTSPVYRHLDVNTTNQGLAVSDYTHYSQSTSLVSDSEYFVDNTASGGGDGSFENPWDSIEDITSAPSNANVRVLKTGTDYSTASTLDLTDELSIGGYTMNYKKLAADNNRPGVYSPGWTIAGDITINNLKLYNNGDADNTAIELGVDSRVTLNNMLVGSLTDGTAYQTAVVLGEDSAVIANDSTLNAYLSDAGGLEDFVVAIDGEANNTINVNNSILNTLAENDDNFSIAIFSLDGTTVDVQQSTITATSVEGKAYGIVDADGTLTVNNSVVTADSSGTGTANFAEAVDVYNTTSILKNSTFHAIGADNADAIDTEGESNNATIKNNTIIAESDSSAIGVVVYEGEALIKNNALNITVGHDDEFNEAIGIFADADEVTLINNTYDLQGPYTRETWIL